MTAPMAVLAVDGGNSKTDLALVSIDGGVAALVRGPQSSPQHLGVEGSLAVLERLLDDAERSAGVARNASSSAGKSTPAIKRAAISADARPFRAMPALRSASSRRRSSTARLPSTPRC